MKEISLWKKGNKCVLVFEGIIYIFILGISLFLGKILLILVLVKNYNLWVLCMYIKMNVI